MTITLAAVYAPIGFLSGLTGVLFKEFAFTLAIAVHRLGLRRGDAVADHERLHGAEGGHEGRYTRFVGHVFDRIAGSLRQPTRRASLACAPQVLAFGAFVCLLAVPLYMFSGKELAPVEDEGFIFLIVNSAPDASLAYTSGHMDKVYKIGQGAARVRGHVRDRVPLERLRRLSVQELARPQAQAHEILARGLRQPSRRSRSCRSIPCCRRRCPAPATIDVELVLKGPGTPEQMADYAGQLVGAAFGSGKFLFADTDLKIDLPQVHVVVDRERVADLGLDLADVGRQLGVLLAGNYVNRFTLDGRAYKVIPQVGGDNRSAASQLLDYKIRTRDGTQVPVSAVATARDFDGAAHAGAVPAGGQLPRLRRRQARRHQGRGAGDAGSGREEHPARRLHDRLCRRVAADPPGRHDARRHARLCAAADLPRAGGAVRQLPRSLRGAARLGAAGAVGRAGLHVPRLHDHQHLQPDRADHAGRTDRQERHPDRRLRQRAAAAGP